MLLASNPSNADTSDINASVEPGVQTAQRSAATIGPGVREHERAHRAVAKKEAVLPEHASALQAAAREDIAGTSMSNNSLNEDPAGWDCAICPEPIDLNDHSSIIRTHCNHIFHRTCLERWMTVKVRFLICFLQRCSMHLLLTKQPHLTNCRSFSMHNLKLIFLRGRRFVQYADQEYNSTIEHNSAPRIMLLNRYCYPGPNTDLMFLH